ncbi:uncharacterized protein EDB91DRAFT_1041971 [Suillus paluster]|uniref:uncharacterized protein n=1 Tax=Suillus paluster TaxID=48578 RepID=UPI001B865AF0|nr:uncharacterized protein EDB91DRAFT_1041971 [Suillus paluster]KAG1756353.1 hypothetical protein EDB91DRAFT_1041971 [Suillus paluster]
MPAERARHAKRLGHVQPVNEPFASPLVFAKDATTSTTTTTQTTAKTTTSTTPTTSAASSTVKLSSSVSSASASLSTSSQALTSSASLQSTFSAPSATIPSTSSPAATGLPSSSNTTSQSVVFVTATSTPSPTATTINNNASSASSQGLSGGAVGGIVAASVVVSLAFFIFIVRKTYLRRRQKRRFTWPAGNVFNDTKPLPPAPVDDFSEKPTSVKHSPMSPFEAHGQSVYASPPQPPIQRMQSPFTGYAGPAPPPASYNNPMSMYSQPPPSLIPGDSVVAMARAAAGVDSYPAPAPTPRFRIASEAVVKRAFIPTLPDELSVTAGERIRVLAQYDDAWALCANGRGEQGMVPQECLDQHVASDQGDWRNARRASSLVSDGRRV